MLSLFSCKHLWKTVAIDYESYGWHKVVNPDKTFDHIVRFLVCEKCGERSMAYDDPTIEGRDFAENHSNNIAKTRSKWIHSGVIRNSDAVQFCDPSYAPLGDFEKWIQQLKEDPDMQDLLQQPMIDDALGQLEVAVKLHLNNKPKDK